MTDDRVTLPLTKTRAAAEKMCAAVCTDPWTGEVLPGGHDPACLTLLLAERDLAMAKYIAGGFDEVAAGEVFGEHLLGATTDHLLELSREDRERIFNLGYFTWVEQQGMSIEEFRIRKDPRFWADLPTIVTDWDRMIDEFNGRTGALDAV